MASETVWPNANLALHREDLSAGKQVIDLSGQRLDYSFYARPARTVAQELLGKLLVRGISDILVAGMIVETEAYCDADEPDLACHGNRSNQGRPTQRTAVMFGPAGHAYVYFTYGMHWMFNVVTGQLGQPNAVLIRALEPIAGEGLIAARRPERPRGQWTNGPAKLAQALAIDKRLDGANLCSDDSSIWIEAGVVVDVSAIRCGPRIGLGGVPEPWRSKPWRYWLEGNRFVSR